MIQPKLHMSDYKTGLKSIITSGAEWFLVMERIEAERFIFLTEPRSAIKASFNILIRMF